jgi:mRNA-degrading endonuclease RelE of RelBE toxin-antitoxin system
MVIKVEFDIYFDKRFDKLNKQNKIKVIKQIDKLKENPTLGKPMQYERKGTREIYIKPYRLVYVYYENKLLILLLDLYHKDKQ